MEIPYDVCKRRRRCQILWLKLFFLLVLWFWLFFFIIIDSLRAYTPPDPPGYFDGHVWPMYLKNRREMEDAEPGICECSIRIGLSQQFRCYCGCDMNKNPLFFFLSNFGWSEVKRRAVGCSESRCFSGTRKTRGWVAAVFLRILYEQMISISQIWFSCQCCRTMVDIHKAHMWNQKTLISFDQAGQWNLPCYQTPKNSRSYHIHTLLVQFCLNNEQ